MRNFILISTILITGWVQAQTAAMQVLVDSLNAKTEVVLEAWIEDAPVSMGRAGTLYAGRIAWVEANNNIVSQKGHEVIVKVTKDENQQILTQTAYWVNDLPDPLEPATPDAYITNRTQPFTKAQVESFCNTQWKAVLVNGVAVNATARDVIEFTVENVTGNTVRVSGLFHDVPTGNRVKNTYLITLVDANGAISGVNVKFEKVVEQ